LERRSDDLAAHVSIILVVVYLFRAQARMTTSLTNKLVGTRAVPLVRN